MGTTNETHPGAGYLADLIEMLGGTDPEKIEAAEMTLRYLGRDVVEFLVQESGNPEAQVEHRLRLLDLVMQIGGPLRPFDFLGLCVLVQHGPPAVKQKAAEVLTALSPSGPQRCPQSRSRRSDPRRLLQGALGTARKLAAAREARQGTAGRRGGRPKRVSTGGKPSTAASRPPTS